jgi:undecaprenyl-diphosphatase
VDGRIYRAVNAFVAQHDWLGRLFATIETDGTILLGVAAVALWLLARPGGSRRWKLACGSALGSAAVALLVNRLIASAWLRERPCHTHQAHVWGGTCKTDPSFPSDHASAAFAIAWAVFLFDRVVGGVFLAGAVAIAWGRVMVGQHYPADVAAGCFVGLGSALLVSKLGRPIVDRIARLLERATDPLLAPLWRAARR